MGENITDMFNITYTNTVTSSHIVFSAQLNETFYLHQLKMIAYNRKELKNIIPPDYRKRDDHLDFFYDITSKSTLTDYLMKNVLSKKDVMWILLSIAETLNESERYLLMADKFVLDTDYIYLDLECKTIYLIYVPIKNIFNATLQLKDFFINFISIKARISTDLNDNYIQRILEHIKEDMVTIRSIKEMLNQLNDVPIHYEQDLHQSIHNSVTKEGKVQIEESNNQFLKKVIKPDKKRITAKVDMDHIKIPKCVDNKDERRTLKEEKFHTMKKVSLQTRILLLLGLIIILFSIGVILILIHGKGEKGTQIFGLFIIIAGVFYIVAKKTDLFNHFIRHKEKHNQEKPEMNKENDEQVKGKINKKPVSRERQINIPIPIFHFTEKSNMKEKEDEPDAEYIKNLVYKTSDMTNDVTTDKQLNTVVLSNKTKKVLFLNKVGNQSKIFINTTPFVIGRMNEFADYAIQNPAIGKSHCEISYNENGVYVKDLISKNGTFINDIKVEPGKTVPVQDGDRLGIANENFIIKCQ